MHEQSRFLLPTRIFEWSLRATFALVPSIGILYLALFQRPEQLFVSHAFHEVAIGVAVFISGTVAWVTWRCYRYSGEPFLRWVAHGLTGFTVVYLPHGALTFMADHNMALFLLFGPASRIVMAVCLIVGLLHWGKAEDSLAQRTSMAPLWRGLAVLLLLDLAVATIAITHTIDPMHARLVFEGGALFLEIAGLLVLLLRRIDTPLMWLYAVALAAFAQSSISFFLAHPWDHQWWLAHLIFAGGFLVLSFGIVRAFHTTRAFATVYSEQELMRRLQDANERLQHLATTDSLTGAANRRKFFERLDEEQARRKRSGAALSLLALDVDHFKQVNDTYGHAAGDLALKTLVARIRDIVRGSDLVSRFGGEEFLVLLPGNNLEQAAHVAERIRHALGNAPIVAANEAFSISVSIGVSQMQADDDTHRFVQRADQCLYKAKQQGRNRVVQQA